jgi:Calcineurin-like phosphoesterase
MLDNDTEFLRARAIGFYQQGPSTMLRLLNRRRFIAASSVALANTPHFAQSAIETSKPFSFILLGDLHYDKIEHHDFDWLDRNHPGDLAQIKNYSRITAEITPKLFDAVRQSIGDSQAELVLQVGDLVEGLCGNEQLSIQQNREAVAFVESRQLGIPFLFTKGNHDVTGDGATAAFDEVFLPFLSKQSESFSSGNARLKQASYAMEHRDAMFCFFDAYARESLEWLEATLAKRTARHCFVIIHPPVVPYGARATWHLYASEKDQLKREKLLHLLGQQNAIVLGGHIHRFNSIGRTTSGGRFVQLAISSVVNNVKTVASTELEGLAEYNGDQVRIEPNHSPSTEVQRRKVYETESPFVTSFAYADLPGHAVITIEGEHVRATIYSGVSRNVYRNIDLMF